MGRVKKHPCEGCDHFYGAYLQGKMCNYLFDTGHMRPCEPGKKCTVRKQSAAGEKIKRRGGELL